MHNFNRICSELDFDILFEFILVLVDINGESRNTGRCLPLQHWIGDTSFGRLTGLFPVDILSESHVSAVSHPNVVVESDL